MSLSYDDTADVFAGMDVHVAGMPPVRASSDPVPLQSGTRWRQVDYGPRDVDVPVLVAAVTLPALEAAVDRLSTAIDPTRGDGRIQVSRHDGSIRELVCRYIGGWTITEATNTDPVWAAVLSFQAADPFWSDTSDISVTFTLGGVAEPTAPPPSGGTAPGFDSAAVEFDAAVVFDGTESVAGVAGGTSSGGFFPFFPLRLGASELAQVFTITNTGQQQAWPVWTIIGPASAVTVKNTTTGEQFVLAVNLLPGETITIDTRPGRKNITNNAGQSVFPITGDSSLWALLAGVNVVSVTFSGATAATAVTARWRRRWLSA